MNLGVLVSGRGTNLQAIIDASKENKIKSKVVIVISNK
ncbi:MAG: formyltransferase family protein, partial [Thermoplasmata archaeon]